MQLKSLLSAAAVLFSCVDAYHGLHVHRQVQRRTELLKGRSDGSTEKIAPKFFIISLFAPEAEVWYGIKEFNLLAINVTVPGFSPILPDAHCDAKGEVCQIVTGEGEINAASTIMALALSDLFDLTLTYFMVAGIAGINPSCGTLGSVSFAKYAVLTGLEYEIDPRELANNYSEYHFALGTNEPGQYPINIYGVEAFELSQVLRDNAIVAASRAKLSDNPTAMAYRKKYPSAPGNQPPSVIAGDVMTSDSYWHGELLGESYGEYFTLLTNSSGRYCMTAQEDNGILESLLRASLFGLVDFSRIISMRTAANYDRPPPGETAAEQLFYVSTGGFPLSTANIYLAGINVVEMIIRGWHGTYKAGIKPTNYIGDVFDSLQGPIAPDIGSPFYGTG